ncbi:MAG: hypothetical protein MUF58_09085 [Arcicella sp.]|jgi:hypothetical protein|nr:hypothetical protein [Arcicella sp.]
MKKYILWLFIILPFFVNGQYYKLQGELNGKTYDLVKEFDELNKKFKATTVHIDFLKNGNTKDDTENKKKYLCIECKIVEESQLKEIKKIFSDNGDVLVAKEGEEYRQPRNGESEENRKVSKFRGLQIYKDFVGKIDTLLKTSPYYELRLELRNKYSDSSAFAKAVKQQLDKSVEDGDNKGFSFLSLIISSLIGAGSLFLILFALKKVNIKTKSDENHLDMLRKNLLEKDEQLNQRDDKIVQLEAKLKNFDDDKDKIVELQKKIENQLTEISKHKTTTGNHESQEDKSIKLSTEPKKLLLYFSTPNKDGSFADNGVLNLNPASHMYEFEINGNLASFAPITDHGAIVRDALSEPGTYLRPSCDITTSSLTPVNIQVLKKGKARLENNRWVLVDKALIKLI